MAMVFNAINIFIRTLQAQSLLDVLIDLDSLYELGVRTGVQQEDNSTSFLIVMVLTLCSQAEQKLMALH